MKLHELKPAEGSRQVRNRVGRGTSSGNGKTAGRGQKGQKARSGGGVRLGFEDGTEVTPVVLKEAGIVKNEKAGIKVLADGELTKKLTVKAAKFSKSAQEAIEAAGGSIEVI